MIKFRKGVFETNSSSTHSLTLCSKKEYDNWQNGKLYWNDENFYSKEDIIKKAKVRILEYKKSIENGKQYYPSYEDRLQEFIDAEIANDEDKLFELEKEWFEGYWTYDEYNYYASDFEEFYDERTTENGDEIVAFGYYGYDG